MGLAEETSRGRVLPRPCSLAVPSPTTLARSRRYDRWLCRLHRNSKCAAIELDGSGAPNQPDPITHVYIVPGKLDPITHGCIGTSGRSSQLDRQHLWAILQRRYTEAQARGAVHSHAL